MLFKSVTYISVSEICEFVTGHRAEEMGQNSLKRG